MESGIRTRVDEKYFGSKAITDKAIYQRHVYTCQLIKDRVFYVVKGYQVLLESYAANKEKLIEALTIINDAYHEYAFHKIIPVFNPHFLKALEIDFALEMSANSLPYLYIEILFEYGGKSLLDTKNPNLSFLYNLMRQTVNALAFINSVGLSSIIVSPVNMLYNKDNDMLKLAAIGNFFDFHSRSFVYNGLKKTFTTEFAPPEILQHKVLNNCFDNNKILERVNVYCWGMIFYSMLLKKDQFKLKSEAEFYKSRDKSNYAGFINAMNISLRNMKVEEEKNKLEFIRDELQIALAFDLKERSSFSEILNRMKIFERTNGLEFSYLEIEKQYKAKISAILMLDDEKKEIINQIKNYENMLNDLKIKINNKDEEITAIKESIKSHNEQSENMVVEVIEPGAKLIETAIQTEMSNNMENVKEEIQDKVQEEVKGEEMEIVEIVETEEEKIETTKKKNKKGKGFRQIKISCGHVMSKKTLTNYIGKKFLANEYYKYMVYCERCNKLVEISSVIYKQ